MKKVVCPGPACQSRRVHHQRQDEPRGPQMVQVSDDWPEGRPAHCSMTCALIDGFMTLAYVEEGEGCPKCWAQGINIKHREDYKCLEPEVVVEVKP